MKRILPVTLLILSLCSCKELVTGEFPEFTPVPAVNSILVAGKPLKVHVSLAERLDTNRLTLVNNAEISLFADGSFAENLVGGEPGLYYSSIIAEPGTLYRLEVNVPGFNTIVCQDILPYPSPIIEIVHTSNAGKDEEGMIYPSVSVSFSTNPSEKQYFEIVLRTIQYGGHEWTATLMKITDPVLLNEGLPLTIFSNELISDQFYKMTINYFTGSAGFSGNEPYRTTLYPLIVELRSCSEDYYNFIKQKYLYEKGLSPEFLATSTNAFQLFSNITGGYGIFAGYSVVASDTLHPSY